VLKLEPIQARNSNDYNAPIPPAFRSRRREIRVDRCRMSLGKRLIAINSERAWWLYRDFSTFEVKCPIVNLSLSSHSRRLCQETPRPFELGHNFSTQSEILSDPIGTIVIRLRRPGLTVAHVGHTDRRAQSLGDFVTILLDSAFRPRRKNS
jgi:hypothetical protein